MIEIEESFSVITGDGDERTIPAAFRIYHGYHQPKGKVVARGKLRELRPDGT